MIIIVLPAYNEAEGIGSLIENIGKSLAQVGHQIVVIDDGSKDETGAIVTATMADWPVALVTHGINRGAGQAIATGIEYACSHYQAEDMVVTMDADNTQSPDLILTMMEAAQSGADVPSVRKAHWPPIGPILGAGHMGNPPNCLRITMHRP